MYHIGKSGKPAICRAKAGNCPLGGAGDHFDSKEACQEHINKQVEQDFGVTGGVEIKIDQESSGNVAASSDNSIEQVDGYIHRSELIKRGWKAYQIKTLLTDMINVQAPEGMSNKSYSEKQVEEMEANNPEVAEQVAAAKKHAEALTQQVDRGLVGDGKVINARELNNRGWTRANIVRLLGEPNVKSVYGASWYAARVEYAEQTDEKLKKSIARKLGKKEAAISKSIEDKGTNIWRKVDGQWLVQGKNLEPGQVIEVSKKNGETTKVKVGKVVKTDGEMTFVKTERYFEPRSTEITDKTVRQSRGSVFGADDKDGGTPRKIYRVFGDLSKAPKSIQENGHVYEYESEKRQSMNDGDYSSTTEYEAIGYDSVWEVVYRLVK